MIRTALIATLLYLTCSHAQAGTFGEWSFMDDCDLRGMEEIREECRPEQIDTRGEEGLQEMEWFLREQEINREYRIEQQLNRIEDLLIELEAQTGN